MVFNSFRMNELLNKSAETEITDPRTPVFISGLPGKMATLVAEALIANGQYELSPVAMASAKHNWGHFNLGIRKIRLIDYCPNDLMPGTIAVDYTTPQNSTLNARHYTWAGVPFIMGTTGGDREEIETMVRNSKISAVIAPNMAVSIVQVQDEIQRLLETSPDIFSGWQMTIIESHQSTKKDVSGTARALQSQLERLGAVMDSEIKSIRDPEHQQNLGIQNLDGHGYHWITLTSPTGEIKRFETAVEGREPYVQGTLMAINFLSRKMKEGSRGEIFTMSDVIREEVRI